jgi:hypothetical protein
MRPDLCRPVTAVVTRAFDRVVWAPPSTTAGLKLASVARVVAGANLPTAAGRGANPLVGAEVLLYWTT